MSATKELNEERTDAFCERIICLHRPGEYQGWWHVLEDDEEMPFAPRGRIVEAPIDQASSEAKRAIQEGLRPLFFVPRLSDWPEVYAAMSHYQDSDAVYIRGQDDQAMRTLLTEPSAEVLEAYTSDGHVLVPSLSYGKALDRILPADMTDFTRDAHNDLDEWWKPRFVLVSRLNAFRVVELELNCRTGWLTLEQFYLQGIESPEKPAQQEPCDAPLTAFGEPLAFDEGVCELHASQGAVANQLVQYFDLPVPQWDLLGALAALARGIRTHLSHAQQEVLVQLADQTRSLTVVFGAVRQWADEATLQPYVAGTRGIPSTDNGSSGLHVLITAVATIPSGSRLTCSWEGGIAPAHLPEVQIRLNEEETNTCTAEWYDDGRSLVISGLDIAGADIGWSFLERDRLELSVRRSDDTLLAHCERIICASDERSRRNWWCDLEDPEQVLFADGERIVEIPIAELSGCVEQAVQTGYRPVIFIEDMRHWTPAMTALNHHRVVGDIYVRGKDDALMTTLLHGPSAEILDVAHRRGRIAVPTLEYGQALDHHLDIDLEDFQLSNLDAKDPLAPRLTLTCRLNPFRYIDATLYLRQGTALLTQRYREGASEHAEDPLCDRPVQFRHWTLDFAAANPFNTAALGEETPAFMQAFTEAFPLPLAFRWTSQGEPPWKELLRQLSAMAIGASAYLTPARQALLALVSAEAVRDGFEALQDTLAGGGTPAFAMRGFGRRRGPSGERDRRGKPLPPFVLLVRQDSVTAPDNPQTVLDVTWLTTEAPSDPPSVNLQQKGRETESGPVTVRWSDDLCTLTLEGVETHDAQLGWIWHASENTLDVSVVADTHGEEGAAAPAAPISEWQEAGKRFLSVTLEGIEQLAGLFNAPPSLVAGYRGVPRGPQPDQEDASKSPVTTRPQMPWVPVELRAEAEPRDSYRLLLKHLGEAPHAAPAVSVSVDEIEVAPIQVDYDSPPMLHVLFHASASLERFRCTVSCDECGDGPIVVAFVTDAD